MTDSANCPYCGQPLPLLRNGVDLDHHLERMRSWCRDNGYWVSPFDEVAEQTAAQALGKSRHTLRWQRGTHEPIPYHRVGRSIRYRLRDLTAYLLESENSRG